MKKMKRRLVMEAVSFLERCQQNALKGKMDIDTYKTLTDTKFRFLHTMIVCEQDGLYMDENTRRKLYTLHMNNYSLTAGIRKIDGGESC